MIDTIDSKQSIINDAHTAFSKELHHYAISKVSNASLGEDLVQDAYIKTWNYLAKGGEIMKVKAFLYHVLNGLIIDEYRKNKPTSLDSLFEQGFELEAANGNELADRFDGMQAIGLIDELPRSYQDIMYMRFVEELSLEEISLRVGKSKNAIAVQVHRGVEKLRSLFNEKTATMFILSMVA